MIVKGPLPPMGWNSYDGYGSGITAEEAKENLEIFIRRLAPCGYEYFTIDAAWYMDGGAGSRQRKMHIDNWGRPVPSKERFPGGLEEISRLCHEGGVKFGVHLFRGVPLAAYEQNCPVKGTEGIRIRDIAKPDSNCPWCKYMVATNPGAKGTQEYYDSVVEYLADVLHVDFIKFDDAAGYPGDVAALGRAVAKHPRPMLISISPGNVLSRAIWNHCREYAGTIRISNDVWDRDEDIEKRFDRWAFYEDCPDSGCCLDLDMIPLGGMQVNVPPGTPREDCPILGSRRRSNISPSVKRMMMTQYALSASALIYGGALALSDEEDFALATHPGVLECNRNCIAARQVSCNSYCDVRHAPSSKDAGCGWVGIFLRETHAGNMKVSFTPEELGLGSSFPEKILDVWSMRHLRPEKGLLALDFAPGGFYFLKYSGLCP